jgi:hypothetical protein
VGRSSRRGLASIIFLQAALLVGASGAATLVPL